VYPPQGENWVREIDGLGFTFFETPASVEIPAQPPEPNDLFQVCPQAVRFMGMALALRSRNEHPSPEQIKVVVDELLSHHFFSQVVGESVLANAVSTGGITFCVVDGSFGQVASGSTAKVAEQGAFLATPDVVINLNFFNNLVCVHPQPTSAKSSLVWISFVEVYREGINRLQLRCAEKF